MMALIVLFSSVYIAVDYHICQDKIQSFQFFGKAKGCDNGMEGSSCDQKYPSNQSGFSKRPCCAHLSILNKSDIEPYNPQSENISGSVEIIIFQEHHAFLTCDNTFFEETYKDPKPKLKRPQLHLMNQVFLI